MRAAALAHQGDAHGDEHHGDQVATDAREPTDDRLHPTPERAGEVEVDRQAEQHTDGDEREPDELVLPTVDGLAKVGGRMPTPRGRWCGRGGARLALTLGCH